MNEIEKQDILNSISLQGASLEENKAVRPIIGNINGITNITSGSLRIPPSIAKQFRLILSQPESLRALSPLVIRCAICKKVVNYPCWYYSIRFVVNHFHYFVCFDSDSKEKPNTKCHRRDI